MENARAALVILLHRVCALYRHQALRTKTKTNVRPKGPFVRDENKSKHSKGRWDTEHEMNWKTKGGENNHSDSKT